MFQTIPSAEISLLTGGISDGMRLWRWIEFGLEIPYFLVKLRRTVSPDEKITQHFLLGYLDDVLALNVDGGELLQVAEVEVLSPGYMNGTDTYRLSRIKEIWRGKTRRGQQIYVLADGSRLEFDIARTDQLEDEMELVLSLSV